MKIIVGIIIIASLLCGCQSAAEWSVSKLGMTGVESIAVLTSTSIDVVQDQGIRIMTESALMNKGYLVVDRNRLDNYLDELKLQHDDIFDSESQRKIGKFLGLDAFLYIALNHRTANGGGTILNNVTGQLVSVESGSIVANAIFYPSIMSKEATSIDLLMANFPKYNP